MKKTKIIATIGPASADEKTLKELLKNGANVFRFNMKHGEISWHNQTIEKAQKVANKMNIPLGIMIDLQGPEIRIETKDEGLEIEKGDKISFTTSFSENQKEVKVSDIKIIEKLEKGDKIMIDDGFYQFDVIENNGHKVIAKAQRNGYIKNKKGLNIPSQKLDLPSLVDADLKKLDMAAKQKIDYIALSFTRNIEDIKVLREEMKKRKINANVVAKIENLSALKNLDSIIEEADGIMVARGDLGIETPFEEIAFWQKEIIKKSRKLRTPVIVATQMLQSMTINPIPTRAEVTDVANAIFNGTDAVMLSEETALGNYPIEAVEAMNKIITFNEKGTDFLPLEIEPSNASDLLMKAAVDILNNPGKVSFGAILVFTKDGKTAKQVSSLRPNIPIFAISDKKEIIERLMISYGIENQYTVFEKEKLEHPEEIIEELAKKGLLKKGEEALVLQAQHWDLPELSKALTIVTI